MIEGKEYGKINVEGTEAIFVPVYTKCFCREHNIDYWVQALPTWRGPALQWHWKRWYAKSPSTHQSDASAAPNAEALVAEQEQ